MGEIPSYDPREYDDRYRRVYEAGADSWGGDLPTEALVEYVKQFKESGDLALDLGCGEGRDSDHLSEKYQVTAIDISSNAIRKGYRHFGKNSFKVNFLLTDATTLPLRPHIYKLVVNVACLHMMTEQKARDDHLREVRRVMGDEGIFFSCNYGGHEPVTIREMYEKRSFHPGDIIQRKMTVNDEEKQVGLPIITAWLKSKEQYTEEFTRAKLRINKAYHRETKPVGTCWIITAEKTPLSTAKTKP